MKSFVVVLIACALVMQVRCRHDKARHHDYNNYDSSDESRERSRDIQQQVTRLLATTNDSLRSSSSSSSSSSSPSSNNWSLNAADHPAALPYQQKITQRLENSESLASQPSIKTELHKIADAKLNNCKNPSEGLEKSCVGRATGQMMQLIAAVENVKQSRHSHIY